MKVGKFNAHRGIVGTIEVTNGEYHGRLQNINGHVDYAANSLEDLEQEFQRAVDEYYTALSGYTRQKEKQKAMSIFKRRNLVETTYCRLCAECEHNYHCFGREMAEKIKNNKAQDMYLSTESCKDFYPEVKQ